MRHRPDRFRHVHFPEERIEFIKDLALRGVKLFHHFGGKRAIQHEMRHHAEILIIIDEIAEISFGHILDGLLFAGFDDCFQNVRNLFGAVKKGLQKKGLLIGEIPIDGGVGNAGLPGNVTNADFVERFDGKYPPGGFDNHALPRSFFIIFKFGKSIFLFHIRFFLFLCLFDDSIAAKKRLCSQWFII